MESKWIGSRKIVDENPQFTPDVDAALRDIQGCQGSIGLNGSNQRISRR